ncbi:MAG: 3'-5' exonuclease [Candidatus Moraniibacteriota bacterium]
MRSSIPDYLPLERPLIIFDLETTGLGIGEDRIIELAYEKIMPDGQIVAAVQRFNPGMPIPEEASRIHHIFDADIADEPRFAVHAYTLWNMFDGADVGGFNIIGFDLPFLTGEFASVGKSFNFSPRGSLMPRSFTMPRNRAICLRRATSPLPTSVTLARSNASAHTGAGDVRVTVEVLEKLLETYPEFRDWDTLAELNENKKLLESAKTEHAPLPGPDVRSPQSLF